MANVFEYRKAKIAVRDRPLKLAAEGTPDRFRTFRKALIDLLAGSGMPMPQARDMSETELVALPEHRVLASIDDVDLREIHLFQIPDAAMTQGLRDAFDLAKHFGPDEDAPSDAAWAASVRIANAIAKGIVNAREHDALLARVKDQPVCPSVSDLAAESGLFEPHWCGKFGSGGAEDLSPQFLNTRVVAYLGFTTYS